ncbi:MAG: hypothetical protein AAGA70_08155 [Pseudomonadota bacterium]
MRSIIFISALLATPLAADTMGCFAISGLENRPVSALSMYIFHNAARQGRYATIQAEGPGGQAETLAVCPTDRACIASQAGGALAINATDSGIEVITERFAMGELDLGNGSVIPERYALARSESRFCGGPT